MTSVGYRMALNRSKYVAQRILIFINCKAVSKLQAKWGTQQAELAYAT